MKNRKPYNPCYNPLLKTKTTDKNGFLKDRRIKEKRLGYIP